MRAWNLRSRSASVFWTRSLVSSAPSQGGSPHKNERMDFISKLRQQLRAGWLGPHFYYDLIRFARKGWPTLARVLFLVVVLVSLLVMDRTQGRSGDFVLAAEFARRAERFAYLLIF